MPTPTLLVADADDSSREILEAALRKAGFEVRSVGDGDEALRQIRERPPDLVLCDVAISGAHGIALCKAVRADPALSAMPLLLMSTARDPSLRSMARDAGAEELLEKPLLLRELVARIRALLARRDRERLAERELPSALHGTVSDLGLVDLFQSLESWKRSAIVLCQAQGYSARVWVRDGQVIDAETGVLAGEAAFYRLLAWETGSFHVEFEAVDREPRIHAGTHGLVLEAVRRADEASRLLAQLPTAAPLHLDVAGLVARLADVPDEANAVLRLVDDHRTIPQIVEASPLDDLATLSSLQRLLELRVLEAASPATSSPAPPIEPEAALQGQSGALGAAGATDVGAPTENAGKSVPLVRFPALRAARRERLRAEAEEARAALSAGRPVRLYHVVELPPLPGAPAPATGWREISPAVSEAARNLAPDRPISPLSALDELRAAAAPPSASPRLRGLRWPVRPGSRLAVLATAAAVVLLGLVARGRRARPVRVASIAERAPAIADAGIAAAVVAADAGGAEKGAEEIRETQDQEAPQRDARTERPAPASAPPSRGPSAARKALAAGESLLRAGKAAAAAEQLRKALRQDPTSVAALLALGDALVQASHPGEALLPLRKAARLEPRSGRAQLLLGAAYQGLSRNDEAAAAYRRYLALEPRGESVADVRSILETLSVSP